MKLQWNCLCAALLRFHTYSDVTACDLGFWRQIMHARLKLYSNLPFSEENIILEKCLIILNMEICFATWFQPFIDCHNCHSKLQNISKARTFHAILEEHKLSCLFSKNVLSMWTSTNVEGHLPAHHCLWAYPMIHTGHSPAYRAERLWGKL